MKTTRYVAILAVVLAQAGQVCAENGQVKFRGTVTADEAHDVVPICYGDYHVTVEIDTMLADPNHALPGALSIQVCYEAARNLVFGNSVEVNGYYWGGTCPKQYCGRVQILAESDYITLVEDTSSEWLRLSGDLGTDVGISLTTAGVGVNTWEILRRGASADLVILERFPYPPFTADRVVVKAGTGNVGIGTTSPGEKLHVLGTALIEMAGGGQLDEALRVMKDGAGRQLVAYFVNPRDGAVETEIQLAGGKMLPWGWSLRAASGSFTIGSVAVVPPALNLTSTGFVGLGDTDPSYRLELPNTASAAGQARANAWRTYSSGRWKTNVRTIDSAMDKVRQLRGVCFDWKDSGTHDIGMVAEEVGRVVPEVVDYEANGTDAKSLAYDRLVALLVEAIKEQDTRITELEKTVAQRDRMEQRLEALERFVEQRASRSDFHAQP